MYPKAARLELTARKIGEFDSSKSRKLVLEVVVGDRSYSLGMRYDENIGAYAPVSLLQKNNDKIMIPGTVCDIEANIKIDPHDGCHADVFPVGKDISDHLEDRIADCLDELGIESFDTYSTQYLFPLPDDFDRIYPTSGKFDNYVKVYRNDSAYHNLFVCERFDGKFDSWRENSSGVYTAADYLSAYFALAANAEEDYDGFKNPDRTGEPLTLGELERTLDRTAGPKDEETIPDRDIGSNVIITRMASARRKSL